MLDVEIHRMTNRFRLPAVAWSKRERLARIFDAALFDLLEPALADAGIDPQDEICIRRVGALVRLRLRATDQAVARAWSAALARAISDAARSFDPDVVIYRSRAHALGDLVRSVLRRDWSRTWAWKELGLWTCGERPAPREAALETIRTLTVNPRLAIAVLADAGRADPLDPLFAGTPGEMWIELAAAVLVEFGATELLSRLERSNGNARQTGACASLRAAEAAAAGQIVGHSAIAAAFRRLSANANDIRAACSIAALTVAEAEPWRLQDPASAVGLVNAIAGTLVSKSSDGAVEPPRLASPDEPRAPEVRGRSMTEFGGLLFLVHVVADCELPRSIVADERFAARSLRWVLHQIAITLTGCAASDPAALAFAGFPPSAPSPDLDEPPVTEHEASALSRYAQHLVDRVAEMFADDEVLESLALITWICERRAEVVGEPGWIEVRFGDEAVDTAIRRRGLDFNPDFVSWLGVVVRFAYV